VQDADDLDDRALCRVKKQVTSSTTVSRNVKSAETWHDLVAGLRTGNVRAIGELATGWGNQASKCSLMFNDFYSYSKTNEAL
jgi:hypothetical protein